MSFNGITVGPNAALNKVYRITAPSPDPLSVDYTNCQYEFRFFNNKSDTAADVTLTNGDGITVLDNQATVQDIQVTLTSAQLTTLLGTSSNTKVSYTINLTPTGFLQFRGEEGTNFTGEFTVEREARLGRT